VCLSEKYDIKPDKNASGYAFKVFIRNRRGVLYFPYYPLKPFTGNFRISKNRWHSASVTTVSPYISSKYFKYKSGFHCFDSMAPALDLAEALQPSEFDVDSHRAVVLRVKVKDRLAQGRWSGGNVSVYRHMFIPKGAKDLSRFVRIA